jgi:pimeloyl-ACP methyl ester carboxylesterase
MSQVVSKDGTAIAFEKSGAGPPLILVDGALCYRASGPARPLARLLASHFTVFTYDRRGRGESTDTAPYAVAREVEDLDALIQAAGGSAYVVRHFVRRRPLARGGEKRPRHHQARLYEAPFIVDDSRAPLPDDYLARLKALVAANRRAAAVRFFMEAVGVPAVFVFVMRFMPAWPKLKAIAHTIVYDITILDGDQRGRPLSSTRWAASPCPRLSPSAARARSGCVTPWTRSGASSPTCSTAPSTVKRIW